MIVKLDVDNVLLYYINVQQISIYDCKWYLTIPNICVITTFYQQIYRSDIVVHGT